MLVSLFCRDLNRICQIELSLTAYLWWPSFHIPSQGPSVHHNIFSFRKADLGTSAQGRISPRTPHGVAERFPRLSSPVAWPRFSPPCSPPLRTCSQAPVRSRWGSLLVLKCKERPLKWRLAFPQVFPVSSCFWKLQCVTLLYLMLL